MTDPVEDTVLEDDAASFDDQLLDNLDAIDEIQEDTDIPEKEAPPAFEPLEPPEFFSKEHKEYFQKLQEIEGGVDIAKAWHGQWDEGNKSFTQKSQALAEERRQYENQLNEYNQYQQALQPINEIWQRQGIAPAVGMAQMAYYGKLLHTDPKALIQEVVNFAGIDINQVVEEQPYIDPEIQNRFRTLEQQNQHLQQTIGQFQQGQQVNEKQANTQIAIDFAGKKDAEGNFIYPYLQEDSPYFDSVGKEMIYLMANHQDITSAQNPVEKLEKAYQKAINLVPEIQADIAGKQEKVKAEAKQAQAAKAKQASIKTDSKTKDAPKVTPNFDDRLKANLGIV